MSSVSNYKEEHRRDELEFILLAVDALHECVRPPNVGPDFSPNARVLAVRDDDLTGRTSLPPANSQSWRSSKMKFASRPSVDTSVHVCDIRDALAVLGVHHPMIIPAGPQQPSRKPVRPAGELSQSPPRPTSRKTARALARSRASAPFLVVSRRPCSRETLDRRTTTRRRPRSRLGRPRV